MMKKPGDVLRDGAATFDERQKLYGDSWINAGAVLHALFPNGLTIEGPEEWARLAILMHQINKIRRSTAMFKEGGHIDSSHDLMVYSAMMECLEDYQKDVRL